MASDKLELVLGPNVFYINKKRIRKVKGGGGFQAVFRSFVICEAIFRGRDLIFFVGAHNIIYFVYTKPFFLPLHIIHPTKRKIRKK